MDPSLNGDTHLSRQLRTLSAGRPLRSPVTELLALRRSPLGGPLRAQGLGSAPVRAALPQRRAPDRDASVLGWLPPLNSLNPAGTSGRDIEQCAEIEGPTWTCPT